MYGHNVIKRNRGIAAITGKNVIGLKSHNVINRKLTLWIKIRYIQNR